MPSGCAGYCCWADQTSTVTPRNRYAEGNRGEHRGQRHLARHLAHEEQIDHGADENAQAHAAAMAVGRMAGKQRRRGQQQVGRQHHEFAVSQVENPAHAIDQHIAAGDQRVDRGKYDDIDGELHESDER